MVRLLTILLAGFLGAAFADDLRPSGAPDKAFKEIPIDQWLNATGPSPFKWSLRALPTILSVHQRLLSRVEARIDGNDLAKRRGKGSMLFYFQIEDQDNRVFQDHGTVDMEKVEEGIKASDLTYTESFFITPGDYKIALVIYNSATGEHAAKRDRLHIAPLKTDPLPQAWAGLPPVSFIPDAPSPDSYYHPTVTGRLHLPLESRRPIRLDVIANLSRSEQANFRSSSQSRNLSILLPAVRVISQIQLGKGDLNVAMLDVARQKTAFEQKSLHELDWPEIKTALGKADAGIIDVKSLEKRGHEAAYFAEDVNRRLQGAPGEARAVIVLSHPMAFDAIEDLPVLSPYPAADARFYYIRFQLPVERVMGSGLGPRGSRRRLPRLPADTPDFVRPYQADQLESTVKALNPRLYDVASPEDFRKALAAILADLSQL